jgi:hypothetical protein
MFMFDIETLGIESTAVVLSAAIICFDPEKDSDISFRELVERGLLVKFDAKDQVKRLDRTMTKSTLDWWGKQGSYQQKLSFVPDASRDITTEDGLQAIRKYINQYHRGADPQTMTIWARGSLDQMAIDSLALKAGVEPIAPFNRWRDVRTAVDLMTDSKNGYCTVRDLNRDEVVKHDPVHDCALDVLMLLRGESSEES